MKELRFCGTARQDLRNFPDSAKQEIGHELDQVQRGLDPDDWKPMSSVGPGVREIRVRDETGPYRAIYIANVGLFVFVLHVFKKKAQATPQRHLDLARQRLKQLLQDMNSHEI